MQFSLEGKKEERKMWETVMLGLHGRTGGVLDTTWKVTVEGGR